MCLFSFNWHPALSLTVRLGSEAIVKMLAFKKYLDLASSDQINFALGVVDSHQPLLKLEMY